ncbi:tetratricopeptide repeat protein 19, mitochondrial isoform X1 [Sphaerodactylus townsendi]|uniref:tetratricopeptide repeat protein 19, mitochondrial isoform X1 n=2 Tax=Sphaerodactylus townsendi TaxID=933632 RepID=UPI002026FD36|nr:tetratricopeptide repeat protein 19, mitochondrial isoform X1 [Sphaerodactylus townsendi]
MSLLALFRFLPRGRWRVPPLLTAAQRDLGRRHLQAKARPRPDGGRNTQTPDGGATPLVVSLALSAFSLFSEEAEQKPEKDVKEDSAEDEIIFLLKKAKLCIMKGELEEAERLLHEAARLSHQSDNKNGIIYTYDTMANLAFLRGQLDHAEKLFKAAMSLLLAGNMKQDDNAIIEMSLKLASIYAAQDQVQLALAGYQFCILTLEEKIAKQKGLATDALPAEEEQIDTHLLLGLSLDSYARYLLAHKQAAAAERLYERALQISTEVQGETHPQTIVLMNDLATAIDAQGRYDDAYARVKRASDLAQQTEHPETYVILNNLAGILMHKEDFSQARQVYKEALKRAEEAGEGAVVQHIRKELTELARRQKLARSAENSIKKGDEGGKD